MYFIKLKKNHHMFRFYKESHVKVLMFGQGRKKSIKEIVGMIKYQSMN